MCIQGLLSIEGCYVKFLEDFSFMKLQNTLNNHMINLSKKGELWPKRKAKPLSVSQEEKMWNDGILGMSNPKQLVETLLYLLGMHFALRAKDEHKALQAGVQLSIHNDSETGEKYLQYKESSSKNYQGGLYDMHWEPKIGWAYENKKNPDRWVVNLYECYMSLHPTSANCSPDFYLRPLAHVNSAGVGYSCQPQGVHTIEKTVKNLCVWAGIVGRCTNHSLCATTATRLYQNNVDKQIICEHTGHSSEAVCSYKHPSTEQLKTVSNILHGNLTPVKKSVPSTTVRRAEAAEGKTEGTLPMIVALHSSKFHQTKLRLDTKPRTEQSTSVAIQTGISDYPPDIAELMQKHIGECSQEELQKFMWFMKQQEECDTPNMNLNFHIHMDNWTQKPWMIITVLGQLFQFLVPFDNLHCFVFKLYLYCSCLCIELYAGVSLVWLIKVLKSSKCLVENL